MRTTYSHLIIVVFVLMLIGTLTSCIQDDIPGINVNPSGKDAYMKIELNLPDFMEPTTASTRAMDDKAEAAITKDGLAVLVFRHDGEARKFNYKAPVSALDTVKGEPHKAIATIKLVKSKNATEKFDIVVIANYTIDDAILVKDAELDDILDKLQYDMPTDGKWKATTGNSTPFPMYGKTIDKVVTEGMDPLKVSLHRALARIDVGLNLKSEGDKLLEAADGIGNFKLQHVYVFKTNNKGYVKGYTDPSITMPNEDLPVNVPDGAERNKDPLHFELNADQTAKHVYVREIYVPETETIKGTDDVHCIVVGGLFTDDAGNEVESYYRLDFAEWVENEENKETELRRLSITRNHRYIFNIKGIRFAGATSATDAFKNGFNPPSEDFVYDLTVWNEDIHEMHVHGSYHFGLDSREVVLGGKASDLDTTAIVGNYKKMVYQTNYPLTLKDSIAFEWGNPIDPDPKNKSISEYFKVEWDKSLGTKGVITIAAKQSNLTGIDYTDILTVRAGTFVFRIPVTQKTINFNYTLDCGTLFVHGTYIPGEPLDPTKHYITVNLIAEDKSIEGEEYELWVEGPLTDELGQTIPLSFKGKGIFDFTHITDKDAPLVLEAKLTIVETNPMIPKYKTNPHIPVQVLSNSPLGSSCDTKITPVFEYTMVLSALGTNKAVNINQPKSGSNKVITEPLNFGPHYSSIAKIAKFNYVAFDCGDRVNHLSGNKNDPAYRWIKGDKNNVDTNSGQLPGQIADVVYLSFNTPINKEDSDLLLEYMEKGGVIVMFLEWADDIVAMMNPIFNNTMEIGNATTHGVQGGLGGWQATDGKKDHKGHVIPFIANDILFTKNGVVDQDAKGKVLGAYDDDVIVNGPFGDVRELQWGQDNHLLGRIPTDYLKDNPHVKIYSYVNCWSNKTVWQSDRGDYVSIFKYETEKAHNFIWFSDAGLMSSGWSDQLGEGVVSAKADFEPFAWDEYNQPAPRSFSGKDTYNSAVFCNAIAWAIHKADQLREKREGFINK